MKAITIHEYGGPDILIYEDVSKPEPGQNELMIQIHAAGVNPADRQIRAGLRGKQKEPFSMILGLDVSGVVESLGDRVSGFKIGDEVYGMLPQKGGYAEYATGPETAFALKPQSLDHIQAAALPVASLTAWQSLFESGNLSSGQKVLIHAASGGVGHIAVQLAKWKGAYVIGTASGRNEAFLRMLGVDQFIDYRSTRFEEVIRDVDLVLDFIPREVNAESDKLARETLERSWYIVKDGGVLVSICAKPYSENAAKRGVRAKYILAEPRGDQLAKIANLVDKCYLKPNIEVVIPLKEANKAHKLSQEGHIRGKVVLQVR
jgi:NADPH:quinone reductase-like Zn-dependent oxidoreductase